MFITYPLLLHQLRQPGSHTLIQSGTRCSASLQDRVGLRFFVLVVYLVPAELVDDRGERIDFEGGWNAFEPREDVPRLLEVRGCRLGIVTQIPGQFASETFLYGRWLDGENLACLPDPHILSLGEFGDVEVELLNGASLLVPNGFKDEFQGSGRAVWQSDVSCLLVGDGDRGEEAVEAAGVQLQLIARHLRQKLWLVVD